MKPAHQLGKPPGRYSASKNTRNELLSDQEWVVIQLRKDFDEPEAKDRDSSETVLLAGLSEQLEQHHEEILLR